MAGEEQPICQVTGEWPCTSNNGTSHYGMLLCWSWVTSVKIGITGIEDRSGRIPSCDGVVTGEFSEKRVRRKRGNW